MRVAEGVRSATRSLALTQSLRMRANWKPKSNFLESTCAGRRWVWRDMPEDELMTSRAVWGSTPYFLRATTPSAARRTCAALSTLFTALTALPAPRGPHFTIFSDHAESKSYASVKSSSEPPTIETSLPAAAPFGPPETGASTRRAPFALSASPKATVAAGPPDVQSTMSVPDRSGADDSTLSTSAVVDKHIATTSHRAASSAKSAQYVAPISALNASALDAFLDATSAGFPHCSTLYLCR
mmetsp:Transcript_13497/g.40778  ORF Transcript_13497/g.40778 Transcript_13497/m.40778 type:complete len:241 (-) Transcript_13497:217-939(-)